MPFSKQQASQHGCKKKKRADGRGRLGKEVGMGMGGLSGVGGGGRGRRGNSYTCIHKVNNRRLDLNRPSSVFTFATSLCDGGYSKKRRTGKHLSDTESVINKHTYE